MPLQDIQFKDDDSPQLRTRKLRALVEEMLRLARRPAGTTQTVATGTGTVESVVDGTGIDVDSSDAANPVVSLDAGAQSSLSLANSAVQPGDLAAVATSGAASDVSFTPASPLSSTNVQAAIEEVAALTPSVNSYFPSGWT